MKTLRSTIALSVLFSLILALSPLTVGSVVPNTAHAAAAFTTPVASSFSTPVAANRQNAIQLQGSDAEGTALTFATTSSPSHGALSGLNATTGAVVYTPTADYVGADSFTYTVTSGGETSAASTVTLTVTNQKTRIIDTVTDAGGAPRAGKVTFILTQATTSPGGLTPKGASVSASLNAQGQFDISVYPSRSMSPAAYYQVIFTDGNAGQIQLGVYDIPLSTTTINLSPYKVLDANLAAQITIASMAAVTQLSTAVASATTTTLLGISPANNTLQKYNATAGTFANSAITDTGGGVAVAANTTITGTLTTTGPVTAENVNIPVATKAMIAAGQLPYSPGYMKGYLAFFDASKLDLAEGEAVSSWPDLSGNGRHAVQATGSLRPIFHLSETFTNSRGDAYVAAADTADYLTVPLPASSTKAFFVVARYQPAFPSGYALYLDANNWLSILAPNGTGRWTAYRTSGGGSSTPAGYSSQYSVICWRMNSANSISVFVDGVLAETFTPLDGALATATSIKIGPGFGHVKQVGVLDYGRAMADAEVAEHSDMFLGHNAVTWEHRYIGRAGIDNAPTLDSEGLIVQKRGLRGKRPLVILNHQAGSTETVFTDSTQQRAVLSALVEAGYVLAISRQWTATAFENSWGNTDALDANAELYAYAVANYNIDTSRVAMVGMSMGGLSTMLAFPDGRIPLTGAACFDCVLDLQHAYDNGFSAGINAAYGITGVAPNTYALKTAGYDPRLLSTTSFTGKRFAFFANTDDATVNFTQNTFDFQAQIASVATEETITTGTGGHLANIASNVANLTAFLARCFA